jgi:hypothetical protein
MIHEEHEALCGLIPACFWRESSPYRHELLIVSLDAQQKRSGMTAEQLPVFARNQTAKMRSIISAGSAYPLLSACPM